MYRLSMYPLLYLSRQIRGGGFSLELILISVSEFLGNKK